MRARVLAGIVLAAMALAVAVTLALVAGSRPGEIAHAGFDGVFALDLDRGRVVADREDIRGVRGMLRVGTALLVAAEDGLHELDATTLAPRRELLDGIVDEITAGLDGRHVVALRHPGDDPREARDFHHALLIELESGAVVKEWRLPPDAHDLVRVPGSSWLLAPRKSGREVERIDLASEDEDSTSAHVGGGGDAPEIVLMRTIVPAAAGAIVYLFELEDDRTYLWELTPALEPLGERRRIAALSSYPREGVALPGGTLVLDLGAEVVLLDPETGKVDARRELVGRIFDIACDERGRRVLAARPDDETGKGAVIVLDARDLRPRDSFLLPRRVAELAR
jgi:hypothetical protein